MILQALNVIDSESLAVTSSPQLCPAGVTNIGSCFTDPGSSEGQFLQLMSKLFLKMYRNHFATIHGLPWCSALQAPSRPPKAIYNWPHVRPLTHKKIWHKDYSLRNVLFFKLLFALLFLKPLRLSAATTDNTDLQRTCLLKTRGAIPSTKK